MRWFLLKNRRHQGPYSFAQLKQEYAKGHLKARDFFISIEKVDAGQLDYQPLYEILKIPAPPSDNTSEIRLPSPFLKTPVPEGQNQKNAFESFEGTNAREIFEKTNAIDFIVQPVSSSLPDASTLSSSSTSLVFEEKSPFFMTWLRNPIFKGSLFLIAVGASWFFWKEYFSSTMLVDKKKEMVQESSVHNTEVKPPLRPEKSLMMNASQRKHTGTVAPLRVPEVEEKEAERPSAVVSHRPRNFPPSLASPASEEGRESSEDSLTSGENKEETIHSRASRSNENYDSDSNESSGFKARGKSRIHSYDSRSDREEENSLSEFHPSKRERNGDSSDEDEDEIYGDNKSNGD